MSTGSESTDQHHVAARERGPVPCGVITVSDTRTTETDTSGKAMHDLLLAAGHSVVFYRVVPDEPRQILALIERMIEHGEAKAILINGGTGISRRDTTYDAVSKKLEKTLPGFGELFRTLSFQEIGPAAMLSRATAGVYANRVVFSMPGSTNAVQLAMSRLIIPELEHLVWELTR